MPTCPGCQAKLGLRKHYGCAVCKRDFCRACCKRYLALEGTVEQVRCCNTCFLGNVAWDSSRTYDVVGPADGQTVVLVHGALAGRQCLVQEARALAAAGYRVISPDLPAHGARFKETLTLDSAVSTLHDVITKEAGGQKVVIMGFSMGGYVTAAFAAAHPDLVAGAVLGACAHNTHSSTWKMMGHTANLVYKVCSYKTKSGFITKSAHMDPSQPLIQECFLRAGAEYDAWDATWRVMYEADMLTLLPKITCPAMLVVGEKDFRSHEQEFVALLKRGRLLVLGNGEHAFMVQPDVVVKFREECVPFLKAADWGPFGSPPPESTGQTQAGVKAEVAVGASNKGGTRSEGKKPGVGLGTVFKSVAAVMYKKDTAHGGTGTAPPPAAAPGT